MKIGILTVSDKGARGEREDRSGEPGSIHTAGLVLSGRIVLGDRNFLHVVWDCAYRQILWAKNDDFVSA
jgi:hypothetical protein